MGYRLTRQRNFTIRQASDSTNMIDSVYVFAHLTQYSEEGELAKSKANLDHR